MLQSWHPSCSDVQDSVTWQEPLPHPTEGLLSWDPLLPGCPQAHRQAQSRERGAPDTPSPAHRALCGSRLCHRHFPMVPLANTVCVKEPQLHCGWACQMPTQPQRQTDTHSTPLCTSRSLPATAGKGKEPKRLGRDLFLHRSLSTIP